MQIIISKLCIQLATSYQYHLVEEYNIQCKQSPNWDSKVSLVLSYNQGTIMLRFDADEAVVEVIQYPNPYIKDVRSKWEVILVELADPDMIEKLDNHVLEFMDE